MNIKKIEEEMEKKAKKIKIGYLQYSHCLSDMDFFGTFFKKFLRQAIKQVVESVPAKEKPNPVIHKEMDDLTKEWFKAQMTESEREDCGYNQHVQEIKEWKKKILKQLEGR